MSPGQLAINEACGKALAEANLQTKPQWVQDLNHANQAFADKATPIVMLFIAGGMGSPRAIEGASAIGKTPKPVGTVRPAPTVAEVTALVPEGQKLGPWGNQIWGTSVDGAKSLIGTRSAGELSQIPGLTAESATTLRNFYQDAITRGQGGATAPIRVELLNDIIRTLNGS